MGLLDDAIRDHLELKRRRGADPGEVARAQRDALEPVFPGVAQPAQGDSEAGTDGEAPDPAPTGGLGAPSAEAASAASSSEPSAVDLPPAQDLSTVGQETVELDMQTVLDEDHQAPSPDQESLEWEVPGEIGERSSAASAEHRGDDEEISDEPGDVPGQERMTFE